MQREEIQRQRGQWRGLDLVPQLRKVLRGTEEEAGILESMGVGGTSFKGSD